MNENRRYEVGLSLISCLNMSNVQLLLEKTGSVEAVFSDKHLSHIKDLNTGAKKEIQKKEILARADDEIENCIRYNIQIIFMDEPDFPQRLLECPDAPVILYCKGKSDLNTKRIVSIVGTRRATPQGMQLTEDLVRDLAARFPDLIIVSGLAYGIDVCAHRSAIENNLNNIAILGHGFQEIYPPEHRNTAVKILKNGSLITEFTYGTPSLPYQFVKRNRIIAGLCDACIVIESGCKGGSLRTAEFASSYNREVFAYPGRPTDRWSSGCNSLIKKNKAIMAESADDILKCMNWDLAGSAKAVQMRLFPQITDNQRKLYDLMLPGEQKNIGDLTEESELSIAEVLSDMMQMEIKGLVKSFPGGLYLKNNALTV